VVYLLPDDYVSPTIPFLYVFFFSVTVLIHYILLKVASKRAANFINYFMLLTFGKLIFFLSIILVYGFFRREDLVQFVVAFFILYLFYTVFEVVQSLSLTRDLRKHNEGKKSE